MCKRKISKNSLINSRGNLKPAYEYVLRNGEIKVLCVVCFNKVVSREILEDIKRIKNKQD